VRRARFGLLVAVLAAIVAVGSFLLALTVLDDDGPDAPPGRTGSGSEAPADAAQSTTTAAPAPQITTGALETPAWILVIASEGDEAKATATAQAVAAAGSPAGVLRSDEYPSMNPGFWVAYAGPYADAAAAKTAEPEVEGAGWPGAYVRCAGSAEQCGGEGDGGED
jgi:hypothetical protein